MRTPRIALIASLAAIASLVASRPVLAEESDAPSILVEGHVFNMLTQVPLLGAKIEVYRSDQIQPQIYPPPPPIPFRTTFTDLNGFYSLELPPRPAAPTLFQYTLVALCTTERGLAGSNAVVVPGSSREFRRDFYVDVTPRRIVITCSESVIPFPGPPPLRGRVPASSKR